MQLGRRAGLCICFDLEQHKAASGGSDQNQRETMPKSCDVTGHGIWLQVKVTQTSQEWGAPAGTQVAQPPSSSPLQVLIWVQVSQSDLGTESRGEQQSVFRTCQASTKLDHLPLTLGEPEEAVAFHLCALLRPPFPLILIKCIHLVESSSDFFVFFFFYPQILSPRIPDTSSLPLPSHPYFERFY